MERVYNVLCTYVNKFEDFKYNVLFVMSLSYLSLFEPVLMLYDQNYVIKYSDYK